MNLKRLGWTFTTIAILTVIWYLLCPSLGGGFGEDPKQWQRTGKGYQRNLENPGHYYYRNPHYFWPGIAVIWPLTLGVSMTLASRMNRSEQAEDIKADRVPS